MEVGRVCIKTAGRDAGNIAIVLSKPKGQYVMIDGNVRRKKCNLRHLEPTEKVIKLKENASTEDVLGAMKKEGIEIRQKTVSKKEKKRTAKPKRQRKTKKQEKPKTETKKKEKKK